MELKAGYKQSEVGVIPVDWTTASLKNVTLDMLQGVNTAIDKPEYVEDGIPMLKANNVIDQSVIFEGADHISEKTYAGYSDRFKLTMDDFLFSNIGARLGTGSLLKISIPCSFAWNVMRIVPDKKKIVPSYLAHVINSPNKSQEIKGKQSGSGMGFIPKSVMQGIIISLPPTIEEQTAIATALSDVDALITSLDELIAKKRGIKQATMQQLLTGKKRLAGFSGKWEVKRLGDVAHLYQPVTISTKQFTTFGYPVYGANGVVGFYDKFNHQEWQVTVTCRGSTCGTVNRTVDRSWITGNAMVVNGDQYGLNKDFLYYLLLAKDLSICITGTGQPQIVRGSIVNVEVDIPLDVNEQASIAKVLSDMDADITELETKRDKTIALKLGMMQELLTGRIRLL